jgi:hypothetical protein
MPDDELSKSCEMFAGLVEVIVNNCEEGVLSAGLELSDKIIDALRHQDFKPAVVALAVGVQSIVNEWAKMKEGVRL